MIVGAPEARRPCNEGTKTLSEIKKDVEYNYNNDLASPRRGTELTFVDGSTWVLILSTETFPVMDRGDKIPFAGVAAGDFAGD